MPPRRLGFGIHIFNESNLDVADYLFRHFRLQPSLGWLRNYLLASQHIDRRTNANAFIVLVLH
ncbi:hypothetical protein BN1723_015174 [Verticillium longisporum]|uniref:Uncharacterized protein n=1 Tax=Verticillium longisporum TaxID=100787 RepID=A0A0G4MS36_VERLO|nr:hypothetical protein BN1723_015174 [Verticillium longisporum]